MKFEILNDSHFGVRTDSPVFDSSAKKFFDEVFFPHLDAENIKTVVHLGDVFDRRKYINFNILQSCRKYFFDELAKRGVDLYVILGNHDVYFKNTNDVNSLVLLLREYTNVTILEDPTELTLDGVAFAMVPWICDENFDRTMEFLNDTKAPYCFGHFEIKGFERTKGQPSTEGFDSTLFGKFDMVLSGHFHRKSSGSNIRYLGCQYEMTWDDYDDPKGFHMFDTYSKELTFIRNPNVMFHKLVYDEDKTLPDVKVCAGGVVKLVVTNKKDIAKFDAFVDLLYANNVVDLRILEDFSAFEKDVNDETITIDDTMTLLGEYVDGLDVVVEKDRLKGVLKGLYVEAQNAEEL